MLPKYLARDQTSNVRQKAREKKRKKKKKIHKYGLTKLQRGGTLEKENN